MSARFATIRLLGYPVFVAVVVLVFHLVLAPDLSWEVGYRQEHDYEINYDSWMFVFAYDDGSWNRSKGFDFDWGGGWRDCADWYRSLEWDKDCRDLLPGIFLDTSQSSGAWEMAVSIWYPLIFGLLLLGYLLRLYLKALRARRRTVT